MSKCTFDALLGRLRSKDALQAHSHVQADVSNLNISISQFADLDDFKETGTFFVTHVYQKGRVRCVDEYLLTVTANLQCYSSIKQVLQNDSLKYVRYYYATTLSWSDWEKVVFSTEEVVDDFKKLKVLVKVGGNSLLFNLPDVSAMMPYNPQLVLMRYQRQVTRSTKGFKVSCAHKKRKGWVVACRHLDTASSGVTWSHYIDAGYAFDNDNHDKWSVVNGLTFAQFKDILFQYYIYNGKFRLSNRGKKTSAYFGFALRMDNPAFLTCTAKNKLPPRFVFSQITPIKGYIKSTTQSFGLGTL